MPVDDDNKAILWGIVLVALAIMGIIATCYAGYYYYRKVQIANFQATIKDLSEEQKCLHICGFQFDYLETYKFCAEKCDRISERINGGKT